MKTPDILMNLPIEDFDLINRHFAQEQVEKELRDALYATRQDRNGISLQQVATVIGSVFDGAEIQALIKELSHED